MSTHALSVPDRMFLQKMMTNKAMSGAEVLKFYNKCESKYAAGRNQNPNLLRDSGDFDRKAASLTKAAYSPWEMKTFWVLVNTVEDEASHVSNAFSKQDTSLFFKIIDELMEENGVITVHHVEELGSELNMSNESTKSGLHKMERLKWLKILRQRDEGPCVTFGARSMTELPRARAFVRTFNADGTETGAAQSPSQNGEREEVEEVVMPRRVRRQPLPRLSQNADDLDVNMEMPDEDEDEIRPVQPRRSSRRMRR